MLDISYFYKGFSIDSEVGNNAFSFSQRKNKSIYVAPLIKGNLSDLKVADHISFSEVVNQVEYNFSGLNSFLHWKFNNKEVFIFDNHNHAFFFWAYAFQNKIIGFGETLVHIDQHTDMRIPDQLINKNSFQNAQNVFEYTNFVLNVGNFIQPALNIGLFKSIKIIDSSYAFEKDISGSIVLDIDMDLFSKDLEYIDHSLKIRKIKKYINQAKFITIATSPFFIDQKFAIEKIKELF